MIDKLRYSTVTKQSGTFGGGKYPLIPTTVLNIDLSIPKDHHVIDGKLYRTIYDWKSLQRITYPDGSHPTTCALVPVDWPTTGDRPIGPEN